LTEDGAKTVRERPQRILEVNKELETMGVRVLEQYAVLGEYDFVSIVEAESNSVLAKAMLELVSRGTIRTISMPAIPVEDFAKQ
jgi:uncharacterized protein with GYD domain